MSKLKLMPYEGLGNLRFSMSRDTIRSMLGDTFTSFKRTQEDLSPIDFYYQLGLQLSYDANERLEFIEAIPPECIPIYDNIELMGDLEGIIKRLTEIGYNSRYDKGGYFVDELGFALYAPMEKIEAVSIYRSGYYET
ncbi:MAG: hypothetical protein HZB51_00025 [Chloroflexi bacterium]|nr:hypothetical protein [Chloroflexota bacterium]